MILKGHILEIEEDTIWVRFLDEDNVEWEAKFRRSFFPDGIHVGTIFELKDGVLSIHDRPWTPAELRKARVEAEALLSRLNIEEPDAK